MDIFPTASCECKFFFTYKLLKYLLIFMAVIGLMILVSHRLYKNEKVIVKRSNAKLFPGALLLLFLPLTPVAQFVIKNQDKLRPADSAAVLGFFVILSGIAICLIPWLLGRFSSTSLLMVLALAFVFTITSMSSISQYFHWFTEGTLSKQLLFWGFVFVISWILFLPGTKNFFYVLITLSFIVNCAIQFSNNKPVIQQHFSVSQSFEQSTFAKKTPVSTPNIYLIVYDAYTHKETMTGYGIDNSAQENFLREKGFVIYPHSYSIGATTLHSMSSMLNQPYSNDKTYREVISGEGSAQTILKYLGYRTVGIFPTDYMFEGVGAHYDVSFPPARTAYPLLISSILMGEFRFDVGFDAIDHGAFVERKRSEFKDSAQEPVFLYSHSNIPSHSQTSGHCLTNQTEIWKARLETANVEMRQDIDILTRENPNAIIIIAGDHGPYLTKNCHDTTGVYPASEITRLDIQDRYGAFLAIHWPTPDYAKYTDITVLQDVFPSILAYLYRDVSITDLQLKAAIDGSDIISGVTVQNGIIHGGVNDGEPLFLSGK